MLFDEHGRAVAAAQEEHRQHHPAPGLVEHDPREIVARTHSVAAAALAQAGAKARDVAALGITNQRETVVIWDRETGEPVHNAIVWQDTRTAALIERLADDAGPDVLREQTGLPLSTYFSGPKLTWLIENEGLAARAAAGELLCGTIDCWLLWCLTGGTQSGVHATDLTNASRTLLMDLRSGAWHRPALELMGIPEAMLPRIRASGARYGTVAEGPLTGVAVCALVGDQQAALWGQDCRRAGEAKCTYGTGAFLLQHSGREVIHDRALLATAAATLEGEPAAFALEGSIADAGSAVRWLRDGLGLIAQAGDVEQLAASVPDNGGVYFVPAFSGLFAPYWRSDARGTIVGLTAFANAGHLARATLEGVAWQVRDVLDGAVAATGTPCAELRVDGGMTVDDLLLQIQADVLGVPVRRGAEREATALGAALIAGAVAGVYDAQFAREGDGGCFEPAADAAWREREGARWRAAVERAVGWA